MECVLQWLDNLDDLVTAVPLRFERLRHAMLRLLAVSLTLSLLAGLVALAIAVPALGPALAALLLASFAWQRGMMARRPVQTQS